MLYMVETKELKPNPDFVRFIDSALAALPDDALLAMKAGCQFDVYMEDEKLIFKSRHLISILKDPTTGKVISLIEKRR